MNKSVNKNILFENFSGRATPLQKKLIEDWIQEPSNKELYYERLDEWENQFIQILPDTDAALEKSLQKIERSEQIFSVTNKQTSTNSFYKNRTWFAAVAAITLFVKLDYFLVKTIYFIKTIKQLLEKLKKLNLLMEAKLHFMPILL